MVCPNCENKKIIVLQELSDRSTLRCENPECGFIWQETESQAPLGEFPI